MKMAHCNMHSNERKPAASDWLKPKTKCIFSSSVGTRLRFCFSFVADVGTAVLSFRFCFNFSSVSVLSHM